jgi:hypothetical protein
MVFWQKKLEMADVRPRTGDPSLLGVGRSAPARSP